MKHLFSFALLCGLCAPLLSGQTVTILDKEGVAHKFNADYVKDITFTKQAQTDVKTYTAVAAEPYGNGNVGLEFSGEDCPTVHLDTYGTSEAVFLQTGVYPVASGSEMYIAPDAKYTYAEVGGQNVAITAGQMTVEEGMEGAYDITFEFTLADGSLLSGQWTGLIDNYGKILNVTASKANQVEVNNAAPGQMRLRFSGANYFEATVDFFLEPGATAIPEGNYFYSSEAAAGTIGGTCEIQLNAPDFKSSSSKAKDGFAFVREGGMTIALDLEDGRTVNIYFTGDVTYLGSTVDPGKVIEADYTTAEVHCYGLTNFVLTFSGEDAPKVNLDCYGPESPYMLAGAYKVDAAGGEFTIGTSPSYSYVMIDGEQVALTGGEMNVTMGSEGDYNMALDLILANGSSLKGTWRGLLPKYGKIVMLTATTAKQIELADAQDKRTRLRLSDADSNFEATVDFYVDGVTPLPQGMYPYSATGELGSFGGETQVDFYYPSSSSKAKGGDVFVLPGMLTVALDLEDGRTANISFEGDVTYLEKPQDEKTVYSTCTASVYGGGNVTLKFTNTDLGLSPIELDCYGTSTTMYLEPGVYPVASSGALYVDKSGGYSFITVNGSRKYLDAGQMVVTLDEQGVYNIDMDLTFKNYDTPVKATWSGTIYNYGKVMDIEATTASQISINDPAEGQMRIGLYANGLEARVDFFLPAGATTIPAGEYLWSDTPAAGNIGNMGKCEFFSQGGYQTNTADAQGGKAIVNEDGSMLINLEMKDGRTVNLSFNGTVTYL